MNDTTAASLAQQDVESEVADTEEVEAVEELATTTDSSETQTFSPAIIPSKEELAEICANMKSSINTDVDVKPVIFRFKTTKVEGVEVKRDALEVPVPLPNVAGLISIIENGQTDEGKKSLELLMDAAESIVLTQARSIISDDWDINATNMPTDKLTWDFIANMPKPERMGGGIAKEVWEDFGKDYVATMPEATGKSTEQVTNAAKLLVNKFSAIKTNMPALSLLVDQLAVYLSVSKRAEEFEPCVAFLVDKADKLMNVTEEDLLGNL